MRICFIVHGATKEGAGRYLLDQVDYLRGVGIGVAVVAPAEGPLCTSLRERGVAVYLIANPWWTTAAARSGVPDYQGAMRAARQIVTIFAKEAIDIAYTQTIVAPSGALAAALAGVPHVWHIHEFAYNPLAIEMAVDKPAMARLLDTTSNSVLFCSQAVAAEWLGGGFIPREKARVVYNWTAPGVDLGKPDLDDEVARDLLADDRVFVVATVGSVLRWKRQLDAVDAVGALIGEGVNAGLLIVGPTWDSDYTAEIREAIRTRGLDRRIRVVGYSEHARQVMRDADVTVICSDREPFGRVTIESMAQGTPVVAAASGGTTEIVEDDESGLLFPAGDPVALADRLRRLQRDESLRTRLARGALGAAKRFQDPVSAMAPVMELFESMSGARNPSWPLGAILGSADAGPAQPWVSLLGRLGLMVRPAR